MYCGTPELHDGVYENHPSNKTLAHIAHTQVYYWPTMQADAVAYVRKCDHCQRQVPISKVLVQDQTTITSPWPFTQLAMDIVGPLPTAPDQKKLLLVVIDYLNKWIEAEAEAFASIKDKEVVQFVWKNIVCKFGIP